VSGGSPGRRRHGLRRAGAAGGCGGRQPHLLPLCGGTRGMISSKWKKSGERSERHAAAAGPSRASPQGCGAQRAPVPGPPSAAAGDSGTSCRRFAANTPILVVPTVATACHTACKQRAFPSTRAVPRDAAACARFPCPRGLPQQRRGPPQLFQPRGRENSCAGCRSHAWQSNATKPQGGTRSPRGLVLLCSAPALNLAEQWSSGSGGCLPELAHGELSPQRPRTALSGEGPMPQSSSWALGAANAGLAAAGRCCLTVGGVSPRPLSAGLGGPGCC